MTAIPTFNRPTAGLHRRSKSYWDIELGLAKARRRAESRMVDALVEVET